MSRLHELAQRLGVETMTALDPKWKTYDPRSRPDKDIAHNMLAKLPCEGSWPEWMLEFNAKHNHWHWAWAEKDEAGIGTFESAVCALAERHLEQKP